MTRRHVFVAMVLLVAVIAMFALEAPAWLCWSLLVAYVFAVVGSQRAVERAKAAEALAGERDRADSARSEERERCVLELTQEADTCVDPVRALHYREAAECLRAPAGREAVTR